MPAFAIPVTTETGGRPMAAVHTVAICVAACGLRHGAAVLPHAWRGYRVEAGNGQVGGIETAVPGTVAASHETHG